MKEVFKDIKGYEGLYQISNLGRVKSLARIRGNQYDGLELTLKFNNDKDGYLKINLSKEGIKTCFRVHRLVAEAFIPNFENKPQINHIDGDKENNRVDNLEWVTCKENINHAFDVLGHTVKKGINQGEKCGRSKLTRDQILEVRSSKLSGRKLAPLYGVSAFHINRIKNGTTWSWL